jgi:hypothetical protein
MASGSLFPSPWFYALDDTGVTLPGAKLYFYSAGTSTPINTYSEITLTTANANPVVADSTGRAGPIYLTPGLSYKLVLKTSSDVLIRSLDNIPSTPSIQTVPPLDNTASGLRLSLTSGLPVTTADVTAATTIYVEPYCGNRLALFDGSVWNLRTVTATAIAIPAAANTLYDVFCYDNSGTPAYELLAWTNDTTRATALVFQDGILVKSGATTRRYLGTFRTTAVAGQTEDSIAKRYLSNYFHRHLRPLRRMETTASWTYTTATTRQANANTANQVDVVVGYPDALLDLCLIGISFNSTGGVSTQVTIGEDSTSVFSTEAVFFAVQLGAAATVNQVLHAYLKKYPAIGRHFYTWQEYSSAVGTTTWGGAGYYTGLIGTIEG